jgi:DNA-binding CsgD family transcriptional regulator
MMADVRRYRLRHDGDEIDITGPDFVVGRGSDCQLVLHDGLVSRRHARFYRDDGCLMVEDLGSRNGVLVNERRIDAPTQIAHSDIVGFGRGMFEVVDLNIVPRRRPKTLPMPFASSDVDGPDPVTMTTQIEVLSAREREVFELIVLGFTQREIGAKLNVSVKTIESHRAHIADKLRCRTRAELVAYAITAGVLNRPAR